MEPEELINNMIGNYKQDIAFARQIALANAVELTKNNGKFYTSSEIVGIAEMFEKFLLRETNE